ncbi:MAG: hypothetical protein O9294_07590 [Cytophagales bacterium]|nr:hypothetical protein [Cytophagales bacterium]
MLSFFKNLFKRNTNEPIYKIGESQFLETLSFKRHELIYIPSENDEDVSKLLYTNAEVIRQKLSKYNLDLIIYDEKLIEKFKSFIQSIPYRYPHVNKGLISNFEVKNFKVYESYFRNYLGIRDNQSPALVLTNVKLEKQNHQVFYITQETSLNEQLNKVINLLFDLQNTFYSISGKKELSDKEWAEKQEIDLKKDLKTKSKIKNAIKAELNFVINESLISKDLSTKIKDMLGHVDNVVLLKVFELLVENTKQVSLETKLSEINIDENLNITLPDYNNLKLNLTPLQKIVYLLFLKYPDGLFLHDVVQHKVELTELYKRLTNSESENEIRKRINDLVDLRTNSLNEKISRIKEEILKILPPHIAKYYYIKGNRGERKKIEYLKMS